jgi:hypothetical protein
VVKKRKTINRRERRGFTQRTQRKSVRWRGFAIRAKFDEYETNHPVPEKGLLYDLNLVFRATPPWKKEGKLEESTFSHSPLLPLPLFGNTSDPQKSNKLPP